MHTYAQTNLQLYNQMGEANYSEADLCSVLRGYELAIQLFSGRYRANGKPFLAHLIGTASILVAHKATIEVVVAGLLHAAYAQGSFGSQRGITPENQQVVLDAIGVEIESLVAHYTAFPWNLQSMQKILAEIPTLSKMEQQIILMRLANDLEDHLDRGMLYCQKSASAPVEAEVGLAAEIAKALGYLSLAEELQQTFQEEALATVPTILKRTEHASFNVSSTPQSSSSQWRSFLKERLPSPVVSSLQQVRARLRT